MSIAVVLKFPSLVPYANWRNERCKKILQKAKPYLTEHSTMGFFYQVCCWIRSRTFPSVIVPKRVHLHSPSLSHISLISKPCQHTLKGLVGLGAKT
ncbi:hypothetical protein AOLI_G00092550 [Acnodon oligacanthus]